MKRMICVFLCLVMSFGIVSHAVANETLRLEEITTENIVKPVAYTHDFDRYGNVVGVLNSDGTKTAYLFSSAEQVDQIDSLTGLVSTQEEQLQRNSDVSRGVLTCEVEVAAVYSNDPDDDYHYLDSSMMIGEEETLGYGRAYLKTDISPLISANIEYTDILSACLYLTESVPVPNGTKSVIQAYLVVNEWEKETITWNNCPDYYGLEMLGCANVGYAKYPAEVRISNQIYITKAIMAWLQGMYNDGILLKEKDDRYENYFYTSNASNASNKPYITVTYSDNSAEGFGQGVENNTKYYIVNKETGNYLTATSSATGTNITQQEFRDDYVQTQQWKFEKVGSGTGYTITLADTGFGMRLPLSGAGDNIILGSTAITSNQVWKPFRNWNGTYHFKSRASSGKSIKAHEGLASVLQTEYSCDFIHYDEWTLIPATKGQAAFFDFNIDIDTTSGTGTMATLAEDIAGSSSSIRETNGGASVGFQALQTSSLFYFSGHGEPGKLNFFQDYQVSSGNIVVADSLKQNSIDRSIESLVNPDFSQLQLAVLSCCEAGETVNTVSVEFLPDNMSGRLYWIGAHNVISYFHETYQNYDVTWNSAFMTNVLLGRSLKTAKLRADNHLYDDYYNDYTESGIYPFGNMNERHDLGNENYIPGFSVANALATRNYFYQDIPSLTLSTSAPRTATIIYNENNQMVDKLFVLPKSSPYLDSNLREYEFDVYMDGYGGVYWYYKNTNILHSYEPYIEELKLGDYVVDEYEAMDLAYWFLEETGYDITGYQVISSNAYSKDYTIEFSAPNCNKKLVFHMQSNGATVYITGFSAYVENYDN